MVRQATPNAFALTPGREAATVAAAHSSLQLGQPQRMNLAVRLPFFRRGSPLPFSPKPLWYDKGWRKATGAKEYTGQYRAAGRTWRGLIQQPYAGHYDAYIWQPPLDELGRNTNHRACFSPNGEAGRYKIHFHTAPTSVDHAITSIEVVLAEAYRRRA